VEQYLFHPDLSDIANQSAKFWEIHPKPAMSDLEFLMCAPVGISFTKPSQGENEVKSRLQQRCIPSKITG
jgi:hypothetical protein